jgi:hypothetical protein
MVCGVLWTFSVLVEQSLIGMLHNYTQTLNIVGLRNTTKTKFSLLRIWINWKISCLCLTVYNRFCLMNSLHRVDTGRHSGEVVLVLTTRPSIPKLLMRYRLKIGSEAYTDICWTNLILFRIDLVQTPTLHEAEIEIYRPYEDCWWYKNIQRNIKLTHISVTFFANVSQRCQYLMKNEQNNSYTLVDLHIWKRTLANSISGHEEPSGFLGFWTSSVVLYSKKHQGTQRFGHWIWFR